MVERLTSEARAALLDELSGWVAVEGRDALRKSFKFNSFN